jgi:hypothetical protein
MHEHQFDYEALTNRQFQALVSALIVREHPRVQCMPLSGRDGGRDVIAQEVSSAGRLTDAIIFQVKMKEKSMTGVPTTEDLYKWVAMQVRRELVKLRPLIRKGAREYVLVLNIPASGDLETGLRDRVQKLMADEIQIPSSVWWRDDLDGRLRAYPDIAASIGLLTGDNAIQGLCMRSPAKVSGSPHITAVELDIAVKAVTAYCAEQYREDSVMRFSQVDLDPIRLLDLFIDVPLELPHVEREVSAVAWNGAATQLANMYIDYDIETGSDSINISARHYEIARNPGAADLILLSDSDIFDRALIEGAPGQGKSTVSQYVCQVHRSRLLGKRSDLETIGALHRHSNVRLPFRVELRRFASWLLEKESKGDSGLVRYISETIGKISELEFTNAHLVAILCGTPSILMFDGLDEVADIETRDIVVQNIARLSDNIKAWNANVRIVVTSRPSVVVDGPAVSKSEFRFFKLSNLPRGHIFKYAEAWISVKKLPQIKHDEIIEVLTSSLESAHVADLARNPMQLAILLYLIHTRGRSLPEKRTALYHSYIDTFQTRESDKSLPVGRYGNLLLDLHGYIAWLLHCRSELRRSDGSQGDIARTELTRVVADYLDFEGYDRDLATQILDGVQRFFLLVERVEGRFEFEVQPLREFFAARHLYTTSPQEPTVEEPAGTRPDRLEALLTNPYWLNVLRFFAGNYQKGELADLARRLIDLMSSPRWGWTSVPYDTIYRILWDYSMYQSRRDTGDVAVALAQKLGARLIGHEFQTLIYPSQAFDLAHVHFSDDTGRREVVRVTRQLLAKSLPDEVSRELSYTLAANDPDVAEWWLTQWNDAADASLRRETLLRIGVISGALEGLPIEDATSVFDARSAQDSSLWTRCLEAGRHDIAQLDNERLSRVIYELSNGPMTISGASNRDNWLAALSRLLRTRALHAGYTPHPYFDPEERGDESEELSGSDSSLVDVSELRRLVSALQEPFKRSDLLAHSIRNIDMIRSILGQGWTAWRAAFSPRWLANMTAGTDHDLADSKRSEIERVWSCYTNRSNLDYWIRSASDRGVREASSYGLRMALTAAAFAWTDADLMGSIMPHMVKWWDLMSDRDCAEIRKFIGEVGHRSGLKRRPLSGPIEVFGDLGNLPPSMVVFVGSRLKSSDRRKLLLDLSHQVPAGLNNFVDGEIAEGMVGTMIRQPSQDVLHQIRSRFVSSRFAGGMLSSNHEPTALNGGLLSRFPISIAKEIMLDPLFYPWRLVVFADHVLIAQARREVIPLRLIANKAGWFRHDVDQSISESSQQERVRDIERAGSTR